MIMAGARSFLAFLLMIGFVHQIDGDEVTVKYKARGKVKYSTVSLFHSACTPREGQKVFFYRDYKIVSCEE